MGIFDFFKSKDTDSFTNIQLKTIPDHIFSIRKSISDRNHKISFINRYSRSN